jgi:hypothetical protein
MGQDRAGFYTHDWVERLLQSGIPDTADIRPEWQHLEVGDLMRTNRDIGGKPMRWPVVLSQGLAADWGAPCPSPPRTSPRYCCRGATPSAPPISRVVALTAEPTPN